MVHHQEYILLCQVIKAAPFGQDAPYQFVVDFTGALLIRLAWITVKTHWFCYRESRSLVSMALGFENSLPLSELSRIKHNSDRGHAVHKPNI